MCEEIFVLLVLCLVCLIGVVNSISINGAIQKTRTQTPNRRFYLYNPEILPQAAAALSMVLQPHSYYNPVQYAQYPIEEEEEEEEEHHEEQYPTPLQLLTFIKQKQQKKKKVVKKKKGNKTFKKVKKQAKKCLPFKVRIIKKSDEAFYRNNLGKIPYGYQDEYFPYSSKEQDMALISFNTSSLSTNGTNIPSTMHFLYPRYVVPSRLMIRPTRKKIYRIARPPRKYLRPYNLMKKQPWPQNGSWRVAAPGKPVSDFTLKEPLPSAIGGSPPPSPLFNVYKDNRIPLSLGAGDEEGVKGQSEVGEEPERYEWAEEPEAPQAAEAFIAPEAPKAPHNLHDFNKMEPNFVHLQSSTPRYVPEHFHQQYWAESTSEQPITKSGNYYKEKYSDYDYYRYGTYTSNSPQNEDHRKQSRFRGSPRPYFRGQNLNTVGAYKQSEENTKPSVQIGQYSYQNYETTEKVVTVTPATFWVPVPQSYKVTKKYEALNDNEIQAQQQQVYYTSHFRNHSDFSGNSVIGNFGDKINPKNCTNCHPQTNKVNTKHTNYKRVVHRKGGFKYHNENLKGNGTRFEVSTENPQTKLFSQSSKTGGNSNIYIEEIHPQRAQNRENFSQVKGSTIKFNVKGGARNFHKDNKASEEEIQKNPERGTLSQVHGSTLKLSTKEGRNFQAAASENSNIYNEEIHPHKNQRQDNFDQVQRSPLKLSVKVEGQDFQESKTEHPNIYVKEVHSQQNHNRENFNQPKLGVKDQGRHFPKIKTSENPNIYVEEVQPKTDRNNENINQVLGSAVKFIGQNFQEKPLAENTQAENPNIYTEKFNSQTNQNRQVHSPLKLSAKHKGHNFQESLKKLPPEPEIITAKYPHENFVLGNASSLRSRRSDSTFSAVVSSSILVEKK